MKESTLSNNYWWCRDDDQDPDSWDYCSPPGQVLISNRSFSRASKSRYARLNIQYMGTLALDSVLSRGKTTGGAPSPKVSSSVQFLLWGHYPPLDPGGQKQTANLRTPGGTIVLPASIKPGPSSHLQKPFANSKKSLLSWSRLWIDDVYP